MDLCLTMCFYGTVTLSKSFQTLMSKLLTAKAILIIQNPTEASTLKLHFEDRWSGLTADIFYASLMAYFYLHDVALHFLIILGNACSFSSCTASLAVIL